MARIIALDFGVVRCGLAVSDPDQLIASGLDTISTVDLFEFLETYFRDEPVDTIVIGDPKGEKGSEGDISEKVSYLKKVLEKKYPEKEIILVDERFTSKMAHDTLIRVEPSKKKRKQKGLLDKISATLILQSYMETRK